MILHLSDKAIKDLRKELVRTYGADFGLDKDELNRIGLLLLTILAEGIKLEKHDIMEKLH